LQEMLEQACGQWFGVVRNMESFGMKSARSFLGRNVNLHLKDGSVIVNVQLEEIRKDEFRREKFVMCLAQGHRNRMSIPLKNIAWAESLNLNLIRTG
jgi:hypothetical protein